MRSSVTKRKGKHGASMHRHGSANANYVRLIFEDLASVLSRVAMMQPCNSSKLLFNEE